MLSFFQFMKNLCSCCFIKNKTDAFENVYDTAVSTQGTMSYHFAKL